MKENIGGIKQILSNELSISVKQVDVFISLYDDGNTVPFIARYRKEATSGLDDIQLRTLEARLLYLREINTRRRAMINSLTEQNKLTAKLHEQLLECVNKSALELIYAPYKVKRTTKGVLAIEAGLEPLADKLWFQHEVDKQFLATKYINACKGFTDASSVLEGALAILIERISGDSVLQDKLRNYLLNNANLDCHVVKDKDIEASKFKDYFEYTERLSRIAPHRLLAILRGRSEGLLKVKLQADPKQDKSVKTSYCETIIANHLGFSLNPQAQGSYRPEVIKKAWKSKLSGLLESQLISILKEKAHVSAIEVFAANLKDLLMAAPAGRKVVLGIDPGFRTGCKAAVIDKTGKFLDYKTIFPHSSSSEKKQAKVALNKLINNYHVDLIAIGNGTASRETDLFVRDCLKEQTREIPQLIVSEAGASVYSASEFASKEFPELDVAIRGAISIARRLQDPLAELVKIDAKAIGVGQYQHDLNQAQLTNHLRAVVEDCVNAVGVDLNSASVPLLSFVAGLNATIAQNIVDYRDTHGIFKTRQTLKKVARLGDKAFQQSAGFLRILDGSNPLDNSSVHPEAYPLLTEVAKQQGVQVKDLINNSGLLNSIYIKSFVSNQFGEIAINDIFMELIKPARDPRPTFQTVAYKESINKIDDLYIGLNLQGVITNVTNFGAFVDIGVHQDGLVHISQIADRYISDPLQVVKVGQIVNVKVLEVDSHRKRIALTMRL